MKLLKTVNISCGSLKWIYFCLPFPAERYLVAYRDLRNAEVRNWILILPNSVYRYTKYKYIHISGALEALGMKKIEFVVYSRCESAGHVIGHA